MAWRRCASAEGVLIGTTLDDAAEKLQANGKIKSLTGGYVFRDGTTQTTAYTAGSLPVYQRLHPGLVAVWAMANDYTAAQVKNAVDSTATYNDPVWMNTLAWAKITGAPAFLGDPTTTKGDLIARGATGPATRFPVGARAPC